MKRRHMDDLSAGDLITVCDRHHSPVYDGMFALVLDTSGLEIGQSDHGPEMIDVISYGSHGAKQRRWYICWNDIIYLHGSINDV